jgi:ubiquinone/menaquinone biosynthesis C-methylase UbiE
MAKESFMNFHDPANGKSYTTRKADSGWISHISSRVQLKGRRAADIGCGGGIYALALRQLDASSVVGVDYSQTMLDGAAEHCRDVPGITFQLGDATATGLARQSMDVVLQRALIHHLGEDALKKCLQEAFEVLANEGVVIVQDRTPEDCLLQGSKTHIRGYFFERFPELAPVEASRRHSSALVIAELEAAGFTDIKEETLWETRGMYEEFSDLKQDLLKRTGRTLLHKLSDKELETLCDYIEAKADWKKVDTIVEQDRWTIWTASKH